MLKRLLLPLAIVSAMLATRSAHATNYMYWTKIAGGCTPIDTAIQSNLYFDTAGTVKHKSGVTGTITLYCNVKPNPLELLPNVIVFLNSSSVQDANNNITVALWRMSNTDGSIAQVGPSCSSIDQVSGIKGDFCLLNANGAAVSMDYVAYTWFVRVDIRRNNATADETLYQVGLEQLDCHILGTC